MKHPDVIVLGTGAVGSAAACHVANRGASVVAIDQYGPAHALGSSHGQTRLIRTAYWEHPDYVPLLRRAFDLWRALESRAGTQLYFPVGLLQIGAPGGSLLSGISLSARTHSLPIETLTPGDVRARFPQFTIDDDFAAIFESDAGVLLVEECIRAHLAAAKNANAHLIYNSPVRKISIDSHQVSVTTDHETITADHLIMTAGPWAGHLCPELSRSVTVLRKPVYWFDDPAHHFQIERGTPGFLYELPHGYFYGIPAVDSQGVKVAEHSGGDTVPDPAAVDRSEHVEESSRVADFASTCLPGLKRASPAANRQQFSVCMYTMTRDGHFIVDKHPESPAVTIVAGLSGHGFKFAGVLGEIAADLALNGHSPLPIDFLKLSRPGLQTTVA